jgi:large subunit ribosomal protein L21
MYAVIETGGKQHRVSAGDRVQVEKLDVEVGQEVRIPNVLLLGSESEVTVGTPLINGASVTATVLSHGKSKKTRVYKMKRRKNYRRTYGHRQPYTELRIEGIEVA